ncbi:MAG: hypothetical protein RLN90_11260 [Balneolaceae bacterium]
MMRYFIYLLILFNSSYLSAQVNNSEKNESLAFWNSLTKLCDKAYSGEVIEAPENDSFRGQDLIMHVRSCDADTIKIPFFVGDDKSRTWVLTRVNDRILLKHDHRHEDGSEDEITQYGGMSTNEGLANLQMFPADQETSTLIPAASTNVWWIEISDRMYFTYNLRRIGTPRYFSVKFDLTKEVNTPEAPWGWDSN